ncbi:protein RALF-like 34 [Rhododendron vialii]|uniref:protein RALF-like 34 n=1 Tax=Rhododendron vialii TaxID=182163 RepID=UPI00265E8464|nr:protein RALF-like 34 [Rhododendron vialii]
MALPPPLSLLLTALLLLFLSTSLSRAQTDSTPTLRLTTQSLDWPSNDFAIFDDGDIDGISTEADRRSLYWTARHYYISYGALSANRIPCPARSGRSYYTHNCYSASGPVRPYSRGCSAITRCRI